MLLRRCVERGWCRNSIVVRNPWLVLSPVVHILFKQLALGSTPLTELRDARATDVTMLFELLKP